MQKPNLLIEEDIQNHIVILDGYNLIFRTIFVAHDENKKHDIDDPSFIYWKIMFLNNIKTTIEKFKPSRFIVTFDCKNTWRKEKYSDYKANRKIARELSKIDFKAFFAVLEPFLIDLQSVFPNLELLRFDGAEGDDIIAILCQNFSDKITIISTDKDFYQLQTNKNVKQYNPIEKKYANVLSAKASLEQKIIGGDKNDNIPAIYPRCGKASVLKVIKTDLISKIYDEEYLKEDANVKEIMKTCKIHPTEIRKNLERNTELIDFKFIPTEIKEKILYQLKTPNLKKFDGRNFTGFLVKHRLGSIMEKANDYVNVLGNLFYKGDGE